MNQMFWALIFVGLASMVAFICKRGYASWMDWKADDPPAQRLWTGGDGYGYAPGGGYASVSGVLTPKTYGCKVGDVWIAIDFEAQAIAITKVGGGRTRKTEDLGDGVLIDRNADGRICAVEILAATPHDPDSGAPLLQDDVEGA